MSNVALLALGGVAASGLAKSAAQAVGNGISFAAELAKSLSGSSDSAASGDQAAQDALRLDHESRIAEFADRIRRELAAAGIDLAEPISLTGDGLGGVAVAGDHPQRLAIEELLASDVLMQRDFARLADEHESLAAAAGARDVFSITVAVD